MITKIPADLRVGDQIATNDIMITATIIDVRHGFLAVRTGDGGGTLHIPRVTVITRELPDQPLYLDPRVPVVMA